MNRLILLRHGESMWNQRNLFCGWVDVPLSARGIQEAQRAGQLLAGVTIDVIFASDLERAVETAVIAMAYHPSGRVPFVVHEGNDIDARFSQPPHDLLPESIPLFRSSALNERMYGSLQGFNKDSARRQFGAEQVHQWRRSFDQAPPEGESLKMTAERTLPYFHSTILPALERGENVLVAAHGNSLRSIVMEIEKMTPDEIVRFELATGVPRIYRFEGGLFHGAEVLE